MVTALLRQRQGCRPRERSRLQLTPTASGISAPARIKKAPLGLLQGALRKGAATYSPGLPVPSAWRGLTSLFGMGRGGTPAL